MEEPATGAVEEPLRGEINPTNQMEHLQLAYLQAVIAAAGCTLATYNFDDGIDAQIKHRSSRHRPERDVRLEVQLKATHRVGPRPSSGKVGAPLRNDRFEIFATPNPTIHKIVAVMILPESPGDWIVASPDGLTVRYCAYWVNIAGRRPTGQAKTVVSASTEQVFDDRALCAIMASGYGPWRGHLGRLKMLRLPGRRRLVLVSRARG